MNKKYWKEYYQDLEPTPFAKFCQQYIKEPSYIMDIGCGNGRDSFFFTNYNHEVIGIDYAYKPQDSKSATFDKIDIDTLTTQSITHSIIYSRFLLHSITRKEIKQLVKFSRNLFMAEFRDAEDIPKLYKDHKRTKVEGEWVKELLIDNGFDILYYKKGRNMAKYKGEDPLCVRVIARKKDVPA